MHEVDAAASPGDPATHSTVIVRHTKPKSNTKRLNSDWTDHLQWSIKSSCNVALRTVQQAILVLNACSEWHDGHLDVRTNKRRNVQENLPMNIERRGFTLLELLVALSIVAILTALSMPSYQQHVQQARRADGQTALLRLAIAQERFRARCSRYADQVDGASGCAPDAESLGLGLSAQSPDGHYRLSLAEASASGFLAHAEPIGHQASDRAHGVACNPLTIDQDGRREPNVCW